MEFEAYMCKVAFEDERGQPMDGNKFFASKDDLIEAYSCVHYCGIVKIKVQLIEVVEPSVREKTCQNQKES